MVLESSVRPDVQLALPAPPVRAAGGGDVVDNSRNVNTGTKRRHSNVTAEVDNTTSAKRHHHYDFTAEVNLDAIRISRPSGSSDWGYDENFEIDDDALTEGDAEAAAKSLADRTCACGRVRPVSNEG